MEIFWGLKKTKQHSCTWKDWWGQYRRHTKTHKQKATPRKRHKPSSNVCKCTDCAGGRVVVVVRPLKGLVIVTGVSPVTEDLADLAVGPLFSFTAVVGGVWGGVGHLRLGRAVLGVVEVEAIADVTEKSRRKLLLCGFLAVAEMKTCPSRSVPPRLLLFKRKRTHKWTYSSWWSSSLALLPFSAAAAIFSNLSLSSLFFLWSSTMTELRNSIYERDTRG